MYLGKFDEMSTRIMNIERDFQEPLDLQNDQNEANKKS
jgi:hypothetical protein